MHYVHKRKTFWSNICDKLCSQNIKVSEETCKKRQNLIRTYKSAKYVKSRTGWGSVKISFYERLEELLGKSPSSVSPHSIDVEEIETEDSQIESVTDKVIIDTEDRIHEPSQSDLKDRVKRGNPSMELVKVKKAYLNNTKIKLNEKENCRKLYIEESVQYKKEKLEIEKNKMNVLADMQSILKEKYCVYH
ncbi:uncharacterized protein [Prorops nasuta]|uniref:uncharacterized protein n=1 Tax=Prorops nasuta TaxID=863751 RepID=UPI0034CFFBAD